MWYLYHWHQGSINVKSRKTSIKPSEVKFNESKRINDFLTRLLIEHARLLGSTLSNLNSPLGGAVERMI
jgi:hypothetical protein